MTTGPEPGEISKAVYDGYRITVHDKFFPFVSVLREVVHAKVDHGARAIFCSREWFDKIPKAET